MCKKTCSKELRPQGVTVSLCNRYHKFKVESHWHSSHTTRPCLMLRQNKRLKRRRGDGTVQDELLKSLSTYTRAPHPSSSSSNLSSPRPVLSWVSGVRAKQWGPCRSGSQCDFAESERQAGAMLRARECGATPASELHRPTC